MKNFYFFNALLCTIKKKKLKLYHLNRKDPLNYCLMRKKDAEICVIWSYFSSTMTNTTLCLILRACICVDIWETWVIFFFKKHVFRVYYTLHIFRDWAGGPWDRKVSAVLEFMFKGDNKNNIEDSRTRQGLDDKEPWK